MNLPNHVKAYRNLQDALEGKKVSKNVPIGPAMYGDISGNIGLMQASAEYVSYGSKESREYLNTRLAYELDAAFMQNELLSSIYSWWHFGAWAAVLYAEAKRGYEFLGLDKWLDQFVALNSLHAFFSSDRLVVSPPGMRSYPDRLGGAVAGAIIGESLDIEHGWKIRLDREWSWPIKALWKSNYIVLPELKERCVSAIKSNDRLPLMKAIEVRTMTGLTYVYTSNGFISFLEANINGNTPPVMATRLVGDKLTALFPHGKDRRPPADGGYGKLVDGSAIEVTGRGTTLRSDFGGERLAVLSIGNHEPVLVLPDNDDPVIPALPDPGPRRKSSWKRFLEALWPF